MKKKQLIYSQFSIEKYDHKHLISLIITVDILLHSSSFLNNFYKTDSQNHPT